ARHAPKTPVEMLRRGRTTLTRLEYLRDQVNPAARRVHLLAPQLIGRTRRQAETAVHAVTSQLAQLTARIGLRAHQIPPANRPGPSRFPGSTLSLPAPTAGPAGTAPHMSTAPRTSAGASTTTTLPTGISPSATARAARSSATNACTRLTAESPGTTTSSTP